MSFNKLGLATVVAMVLSAGSAMAADPIPSDTGTITFHGMVSNNTCKVSLDQKLTRTVTISTLTWIPCL